jgi:hypothetical protein
MIGKRKNIPALNRPSKLLLFLIPLLLLFLLMVYAQNFVDEFYPPLEKRLENNTRITLDVDRVQKVISDNQYVVSGIIISFPDSVSLKEGERISAEGVYTNSILQVEKYHIHKYYRIKYHLSFLGLPVLLYYLRKEWKFDFHTFRFKGKGG